jgi:hypothetical protein
MRLFLSVTALALSLVLTLPLSNVWGQPNTNAEGESSPSMEDLEKELNKTLKLTKTHFEDIQKHLDQAGVDRDPLLDEAIKELEKDNQSLMEIFEGLGSLLLKAHTKPGRDTGQEEGTPLADLELEFMDALEAMNEYIAEREKYWEGKEVDPDTMLEEELKQLQDEQEFIEGIIEQLAAALADSWKEVLAGWGDSLEEWEALVKDLLFPDE